MCGWMAVCMSVFLPPCCAAWWKAGLCASMASLCCGAEGRSVSVSSALSVAEQISVSCLLHCAA